MGLYAFHYPCPPCTAGFACVTVECVFEGRLPFFPYVSPDTPVRHMIPVPATPGRQRRMVCACTGRCGFWPGEKEQRLYRHEARAPVFERVGAVSVAGFKPLVPGVYGVQIRSVCKVGRNAAAVLRVRSAMAQIYSPFACVPCCSPVAVRSLFRPSMPAVQEKESVRTALRLCRTPSFFLVSDPGGARTLDPMIKSHLLYQLSYGVMLSYRFAGAKVVY